jgi:diguanylate cyclase (GGDEF)-like protein
MESHRPDVVLLDVSLPQVSGLDLCRLLRAQPSYQDLPILFVTANTSADMRIACFKAGADDYVTKPISREELLARIRGRHERARMARARAERDPLTGLLLRRAFADAFERSIAQARRSSTGLAVAILDLDHFKKVNDRYGHTMGDTVLATFARMFRARLRTEDIRGRWGGEEFIVALQGLDAQTAAKVIVRSMEEFQRVSFRQGAEAFNVTFSSGIASFPDDGDSLEELVKVADRRLYRAKEEGRAQACAKG